MKVEDLIPYVNNPRNNENAVDKVASSIAEFGFKNPIIIDKNNVVINGHTRLLASKKLGLKEVPVVIKELTDAQVAEIALVENLQRENLNPVEEAKGYKALIELYDLTQEEAASKVGKSREAISNIMRILKLPENEWIKTYIEILDDYIL